MSDYFWNRSSNQIAALVFWIFRESSGKFSLHTLSRIRSVRSLAFPRSPLIRRATWLVNVGIRFTTGLLQVNSSTTQFSLTSRQAESLGSASSWSVARDVCKEEEIMRYWTMMLWRRFIVNVHSQRHERLETKASPLLHSVHFRIHV